MAELISFLALTLSVVALLNSNFHRRQDRNAELARLAAELRSMLRSTQPRPRRTRETWRGLMAAQGRFHSGARLKVDQDLEAMVAEITKIAEWVSRMPTLPNFRPRSEVERKIVEAMEVRDRLSEISSDLDERDTEAAALGSEVRAREGF